MESLVKVVETLGFPIACVVLLGYVGYKYLNRIMDENQQREKRYQDLLEDYADKMGEITKALTEIKNALKSE